MFVVQRNKPEGISHNLPVKRENEKFLSFVKTTSWKTALILERVPGSHLQDVIS